MTSPAHRAARSPNLLQMAVVVGITAGVVDVMIALLQKPKGFEPIGAIVPPMVATAAMLALTYVLAWAAIRGATERRGLDMAATAAALAALVAGGFTTALLAGLHTMPLSPQALLRAAIVAVLAGMVAMGAYAAHRRIGAEVERIEGLAAAAAVILFEVLLYEWVQVYAIDSVRSAASLVLSLLLLVMVSGTLAAALTVPRAGVRVLRLLAVVMVVAPLGDLPLWERSFGPSAAANDATPSPRHIVLVTVDTLRPDALSAYRTDAPRTPAIDALAADGVLFQHALSPAPWTLPSLTSVLTGLSPRAHLVDNYVARLSDNVTTLAERLQQRGYATAAMLHNDLLNPQANLSQGFLEYRNLYEPWYGDAVGASLLQYALPSWFPPRSWPSTSEHTDLAVDWLERHQDRDFFFWLHILDPHAPYAPPADYLSGRPASAIGTAFEGQPLAMSGSVVPSLDERRWIRALYDSEVRYVDANIGRVTSTLKRLGLYDSALIVFTSDHGEEFWEHGSLGHGHTMYDEVLRVPLILKLPESAARGRTATPVLTTSITPTVLDLAGIQYPAADMSAASLVPLLADLGGPGAPVPLVSSAQMLFDRREAVRFGSYKYIVSRIDNREELFDLAADPGERRSIAAEAGEQLEQGRRLSAEYAARETRLSRRLRIEEGSLVLDEDVIRRLRSLGYVR